MDGHTVLAYPEGNLSLSWVGLENPGKNLIIKKNRKGGDKPCGRVLGAKMVHRPGHHPRARKEKIDGLPVIFTVGHSTRTLEEFVQLLRGYGIRRLVDIRTIPRSRHNPQFDRQRLSQFLRNHRINYRHMKSLGGLRHTRPDSINMGWRNPSFRGFADYMQTAEFTEALEKLMDLARSKPTAIMCAEAVPWRCHRSLIGDALLIRGFPVQNIFSPTHLKPHTLTPMAKVRATRVYYPA